jgi:hypothetical protein
MTWIIANWVAILAAGSSDILVLERVAKLTPTKTDDQLLKQVFKLVRWIGSADKNAK